MEISHESPTPKIEFQQAKLEQLLKEKGLKKSTVVRSGEAVVVHAPLFVLGGNKVDASLSIEKALKESGVVKYASVVTTGMLPVVPLTVDCFAIGMVSNESKVLHDVPKPAWVSVEKSSDERVVEVTSSIASSVEPRKHVAKRLADMADYAFHLMGTTDITFQTTLAPINQLVGLRMSKNS